MLPLKDLTPVTGYVRGGCTALGMKKQFPVFVDESAILQEKIFVYKVIDGKACSAAIQVLPRNNGVEYIVESGLEVGDVIIAEGAGLVREGEVIKSEPIVKEEADATEEQSETQE
jgi:hypothetical protein